MDYFPRTDMKSGDDVVVTGKLLNWFYDRTPYEEVTIEITDEKQVKKIDPSEPVNGQRVWAKLEEDLDWEEATFIGIDDCGSVGRYVARGEKRGYRRYINITTTDPRENTQVKDKIAELEQRQREIADEMKELKRKL